MVQFIFEGSRTKLSFWSKFAYVLVRTGVARPSLGSSCWGTCQICEYYTFRSTSPIRWSRIKCNAILV